MVGADGGRVATANPLLSAGSSEVAIGDTTIGLHEFDLHAEGGELYLGFVSDAVDLQANVPAHVPPLAPLSGGDGMATKCGQRSEKTCSAKVRQCGHDHET